MPRLREITRTEVTDDYVLGSAISSILFDDRAALDGSEMIPSPPLALMKQWLAK